MLRSGRKQYSKVRLTTLECIFVLWAPLRLVPLESLVPLVTTGAISFLEAEGCENKVAETMAEAARAESLKRGRIRVDSFESGEKTQEMRGKGKRRGR